jgi:uncharacterized membrane protein
MVTNAPLDHSNRTPDEAASRAAATVTALTLAVAFGAMALGIPWFWVAFPVGFGGVLPLAVAWARGQSDGRGQSTAAPDRDRESDDALSALRERYARGDIDETEFERRVEGLLETERR